MNAEISFSNWPHTRHNSVRFRSVAPLAMLLPAASGACTSGAEVRYRVNYTVDDNGITRSASGVWSHTVRSAAIPLADKYESEFHGEAIPLRLPGRGVLLLMPIGQQGSDADASRLVRQLFSHRARASDEDRVGNTAQVAEMVGQSRSIRCERYATPQPAQELRDTSGDLCLDFAFITTPSDRTTFRRMTIRQGVFDGIAGVRLRAAHVTITRDPVTRGIERLLPWVSAVQEYWNGRLISGKDRKNYAYEMIYIRR